MLKIENNSILTNGIYTIYIIIIIIIVNKHFFRILRLKKTKIDGQKTNKCTNREREREKEGVRNWQTRYNLHRIAYLTICSLVSDACVRFNLGKLCFVNLTS